MATDILGLPSSDKFAAEGDRFYNHRREIMRYFPQGGASLTGLLSMIETEPVNDSIYIWYEDRYVSPTVTCRGTAALTSTAPSTGDADDGTTAGTGAKAIATDFYLKVSSTVDLKTGHLLRLESTGMTMRVIAVTRGVSDATLLGYVKVNLQRAYTIASATEYASGVLVRVVGTAMGEGASATGIGATSFKRPFPVQNTTQIVYDKFEFPGSVLDMGLKYDKTGPYRKKSQDTLIEHMTGIERSLFWGKRATTSRASFDTSQESLTTRTFSGILEFLELWDAGATGIAIDGATYAPYSQHAAVTLDTDDNKRIITNSSGVMTKKLFDTYIERCGRYHHNRTNEKLVICGSGALMVANEMFQRNSQFQVRYGEKAYGLSLMTYTSPFGDFHFVTHPLWNEDATLRHWMMMLDIWSFRIRPLANRDTRLLKNQQPRGADFRRDAYRTELGLECWQPEGNLLWKNIQTYSE